VGDRAYQTLFWLSLVTVAKLVLFFFLLSFAVDFDDWGRWIFYPLRHHPEGELVIVMVIVPCILNVSHVNLVIIIMGSYIDFDGMVVVVVVVD